MNLKEIGKVTISFKFIFVLLPNIFDHPFTYEVKKKLENKIENFISTEIEWIPYNKVSLTDTNKIDLNKFLDNLESDDDIQKIYTNME